MKTILKKLITRVKEGDFLKNTVTLMSGTSIGQLIPIAVSPLLTRLYTPEQMGMLGLFLSISSILSIVAAGRYEFAVMAPADKRDALSIVRLAGLITTCYSALLLVLLLIAGMWLPEDLVTRPIWFWLMFLPLTVLLNGYYQTLNYWNNRSRKYKGMARARVLKSAGMSAVNLGFFKTGMPGLIGGYMVGQVLATAALIKGHFAELKAFSSKEWLRMKAQALQYKQYPLKSSIGAMLNTLATQLPVVMIGYYFGPAILGFFALNQRVLNVPMAFIGSAVAQVFFEKATEADRKNGLKKLVYRSFAVLSAIGFLPMMVMVFFGEDLFILVFGDSWRIAGEIARVFAPFYFVRFIISSLSLLIMVKSAFAVEIRFNVYLLLLQVASIIFGHLFFQGIIPVIYLLSGTGIAAYVYLGYRLFRMLDDEGTGPEV